MNQSKAGMLKMLVPKLIINWLVPLLLYILLRDHFTNDTAALALAGCVPAVWTIVLWLWRRQVNWIGMVTIGGLIIALIVSLLSGGGSLPLKLYHPIITGVIGLVFLISVSLKKPLMLVLLKKFKVGESARFSNPIITRKLGTVTIVFGSILLVEALLHVVMALILTTGTYLVMSKVVTIVMLVGLYFAAKWTMKQK